MEGSIAATAGENRRFGRAVTVQNALESAVQAASRAVLAESERWGLWAPVLLGAGILFYFSLPEEPGLAPALAGALLLAAAQRMARTKPLLRYALMAAFCGALGFAAAAARTALIWHEPLKRDISYALLEGEVLAVTNTGQGRFRADVRPAELERARHPLKAVRLTYYGAAGDAQPGDLIRVPVKLWPNSTPALPGGFDYGRHLWFEGIGAGGVMIGTPEKLGGAGGLFTALRRGLHDLRSAVSLRVLNAMEAEPGAVAVALMTGERSFIPQETQDALRASGLAHVLAISGLHMALLTGALFGGLRLLIACLPGLALRYPVKKWAAALALAGAGAYLVISGMSVATQRAFVMVGLVLLAVMLDRPAITMRNVALAACLILLLTPESLLSAGFQMSFAAVMALVAAYETRAAQINSLLADWRARGPLQLLALYTAGLLLTSFVAGLATAPFAAFHFNRVAAYGLAGNLLAMPLVAFLIMPFAVFAFALMPFGLEAAPLFIMELGLKGLLWAAGLVSSWPGSATAIPAAPPAILLLLTFGGIWLCLWKGNIRHAGLVPIAAAIVLWGTALRPDVLISDNGRLIAVRMADGTLSLNGARARFDASLWLRSEGDLADPRQRAGRGWRCDGLACLYGEAEGPRIAQISDPRALSEDCLWADILILKEEAGRGINRETCPAPLLLTYRDLQRKGAHALYRQGEGQGEGVSGWRMATVAGAQGNRPWVPRWPLRRE